MLQMVKQWWWSVAVCRAAWVARVQFSYRAPVAREPSFSGILPHIRWRKVFVLRKNVELCHTHQLLEEWNIWDHALIVLGVQAVLEDLIDLSVSQSLSKREEGV